MYDLNTTHRRASIKPIGSKRRQLVSIPAPIYRAKMPKYILQKENVDVAGKTKNTKMPYSSSMFYRDYHNPRVRDLNHVDAKEFRLNYQMSWIWVNKYFRGTRLGAYGCYPQTHYCRSTVVCPPEIKILDVLYWLGEGCSFRTIYNLSGRVLSRLSVTKFAKKFCSCCLRHNLAHVWIKFPTSTAELCSMFN